VDTRRKAFIGKWRVRCEAVATSREEAGDRLFTFARLSSELRQRLGDITKHSVQPISAGVVRLSAPGHDGTALTQHCFTSSVVQAGWLSSSRIG
jgi:hypothetical protein